MKYSLIEMLMNLFEKSLNQLKENQIAQQKKEASDSLEESENDIPKAMILKSPSDHSTRVFTYEEQIKLTKASYQLLMRLTRLGIIAPEAMEMTINHLMLSESRQVSLNETKWTLRNILGDGLDEHQLAFLDLVLYQKEDNLPIH